jgi:acyl-CoA synthetase (AMP-forming)/AMP-acid ligase II
LNEAGPICEEVDADGIGKVLPGVEFRVLDDAGRDLPPGEIGTLALRTPAVADGYLDTDAATNAAPSGMAGSSPAMPAPRWRPASCGWSAAGTTSSSWAA